MVSASLFSVLRVSPLIGRGFTDEDERDGAPRVAILNYGLWQRHFGGQANVIGQTLTLDDEHYEVVGVMPRGFDFPQKGTDVWVPKVFTASEVDDRNSYYLNVIARLKTGVSLDHAQSELNVAFDVAEHVLGEDAFGAANAGIGLKGDLAQELEDSDAFVTA